jgi:hypothetical protein
MFDTKGDIAMITSATFTIILGAAQATSNSTSIGTATGTLTLVSSLGSVSGAFTADYSTE